MTAVRRLSVFLPLVGLLLLGCEGDGPVDPEPVATSLEPVGGGDQNAQVGAALPDPVVLRVLDDDGEPMAGVPVEVTVSGGSVAGAPFVSDEDGLVSIRWTLGPVAGTQTLHAAIETDALDVSATAEPGPALLEIVSGDDQTDTVATALPLPLTVRAVDAFGNAVASVPVTFVVTSGGGSVFLGTTTTNAQGIAHEQWTLGTSTTIPQTVEARAIDPTSGTPYAVEFSATALPAVPERVEFVHVPGSGTVGEPLADPVTARATDRYGNPTSGATVEWMTLSGGSVSPAASATDATGITAASWTLGSSVGTHRLRVSLGAHADTATTTAGPGAPSSLEITGGNPQSGPVGSLLREVFEVWVRDQYGNPVPGVELQWIVTQGSIINTSPSDAAGYARARWQLGTVAGPHYAIATIGVDSVTFTVDVRPGPLNSMEITPDSAVLSNVGDTVRFRAQGRDEYGNPIPDVPVVWSSGDSTVASVTSSGLVTAKAHGLVGIEARHSSGRVDMARVTMPILGTERVVELTTSTVPEAYQMVGDYVLYRHQPAGQSQFKETVLHRISTGEVLWRVTIDGEVALGDRYAITTTNGNTHVYDIQTGTSSQFSDVDGSYSFGAVRPSTSGDWIAYEAYTGLPSTGALRQGIRVQNMVTGETRYVTTSRSASGGFTCEGRPVFDHPYLAFVDSGWIKVYDVATATTTNVVQAAPSNLSLSGTRVAWSTLNSIMIHDFSTGFQTTIVADGQVTCAVLDDDIVGWSTAPAGFRPTHDVFMQDLSTGETLRVTHTDVQHERTLSLDAGRVLFRSFASGDDYLHLFEPY